MTSARIPWHRRLAVRLALLLAITLVSFDVLAPRLIDAILGWFDIPSIAETVTIVGDVDSSELGPMPSTPMMHLGGMPEMRVDGVTVDENGAPQIHDAAFESMAAGVASIGGGVVVSDATLRVVRASPDLPLTVGERWSDATLNAVSDEPINVNHMPIVREGEFIAWVSFVIRPLRAIESLPDELTAAFPDMLTDRDEPPVVLGPKEFQQMHKSRERAVRTVSWLLTIATALALSILVSRLVTRRLSHLASAAMESSPAAPNRTEPFPVSGHDEIAHLAGALNHSRKRAIDLLDERDDRDVRRREWIAQVSHDLRTPLTALLACLERAGDELQRLGPSDERAQLERTLGVAQLDADRVSALADDLLQIARLDTQAELRREPVLPGELIERCVRELEPLAEARTLALAADIPHDLAAVDADGHLLLRALENVVRNAIQHGRTNVTVAGELCDGELCIRVTDDGPGFPGPPGPVDTTTMPSETRRRGGAGLGLEVARRILEAHDGRLLASNPETGGALVELRVPATAPQ